MGKIKNQRLHWLKAWRARMYLRVHGFLTDAENLKVKARIDKFGDNNGVFIEQSEIEKQRMV